MEAILYNPCSIARCWRLLNILETLTADIVMLTGLRYRRRATTKLPYETVRVGRYFGYIWGYADGALTNKAAGVGIFMTRRIRMDHVVEISSPEKWLQGRAGMVRLKGGRSDITTIVGYPPPDTGKHQTKAVKETMKWIRGILEKSPQRTLPLVGLDNVGVATGGIRGVGNFNLSTHNTGGAEVLKIVNDLGMALPGTMWREAGPTYHSTNTATTPDHWLVPDELCGGIHRVKVLWKAGRKLQLIPSRHAMDHLPILLSFDYELKLDKTADGRTCWDQDKIALCLQTGIGRREFLEELAEAFEGALEEVKEREEDELPDKHWEKRVGPVHEVLHKGEER